MKANSWETAFCFLAAGIVAGWYFRSEIPLLVAVFTLLLPALIWLYGFRPVMAVSLFLPIGLLLSLRIMPLPPPLSSQSVVITGRISEPLAHYPGYAKTVIETREPNPYLKRIYLYLPAEADGGVGEEIRVYGRMSTIRGLRNPGDPNRRQLLGFQHVYYQIRASRIETVSRTIHPFKQRWYKRFAVQSYAYMPARQTGILTSILWGNTGTLTDEDYNLFKETGLLHIFAVSGMNVAYIILMAALITGMFTQKRKIQTTVGLAVVVAYSTLIGWPVSVVRAVMMASLSALALLGGRQNDVKEALFLAAFLMLVLEPGWLFTPGYQLTVVATWGLVVLYPAWLKKMPKDKQNSFVKSLLAVAAAETAVFPLTVYYFNLVAPISLLANLLIAHLIGLVVGIGTLSLFTCYFSVSAVFIIACRYLLDLVLAITSFLHQLPYAHWWVPTPPLILVIVFYCLLFISTYDFPRVSDKDRGYSLSAAIVLIVIIALPRPPHGDVKVTFLDVGQGDCIHISTPSGRQVLIDGGGSRDYPVGEMIVIPYLHRQGVNHLDLVINTHPHDDHLLGLLEVEHDMPCSLVAFSSAFHMDPTTQRARDEFAVRGARVLYLKKGDRVVIDHAMTLDVLSPEGDSTGDVNNRSLVTLLNADGRRFLLMGDAEAQVAASLVEDILPGRISVIKVGHHGSRNSICPDFYQRLDPDLAVISVGRNNPFGHPSLDLIRQLEEYGIRVLRTDVVGAVQMTIRGPKMDVRCWGQRQKV